MIPQKANYSILAQCDIYAVSDFVEKLDRPAATPVRPISERQFKKRIKEDVTWNKTYNALVTSYKSLSPNYKIVYDTYGGYRLVYCGNETISSGTTLKGPVGFIRPFPDGAVTDLSVMTSSKTGEQLLLLGPIRFVNSDCDRNCDYDFSSSEGVIQLVAKKPIQPGDELFVKYDDDFFQFNECRCSTCRIVHYN